MGQRAQIFILTPKVHYDSGSYFDEATQTQKENCNNRAGHLYVLHNQWLYGHTFIRQAAKLIKALQHHFKGACATLQEKHIEAAIQFANVLSDDPEDTTRTQPYFDTLEASECTHILAPMAQRNGTRGAREFLNHYDNNNGRLLIAIDEQGKLMYEIFTGSEDDERAPRSVSPQQYVAQFYNLAEATRDAPGLKEALDFLTPSKGEGSHTLRRGDVLQLYVNHAIQYTRREKQRRAKEAAAIKAQKSQKAQMEVPQ